MEQFRLQKILFCVCMYVCTYVRTYVGMYVCMYLKSEKFTKIATYIYKIYNS